MKERSTVNVWAGIIRDVVVGSFTLLRDIRVKDTWIFYEMNYQAFFKKFHEKSAVSFGIIMTGQLPIYLLPLVST